MAWWTPLFLQFDPGRPDEQKKEEGIFALLRRAVRRAFYENFVDTLYSILTVSTYAYLIGSILIFFFQNQLPTQFVYIIATFSEPYLGALGVYLVVNEIRRRAGKTANPHLAAIFTATWMILLVVSTALVIGRFYYFNTIYRIIVTNSLAALIIRVGTVIGRVP